MKTFIVLFFSLAGTATGYAQNIFPASGNVGIGTTSPGAPLHIVGSNAYPHLTVAASASAPFGAFVNVDASAIAGGKAWFVFSSGGSAGEGAGKLIFKNQTDGTYPLTLNAAGNVGIGTTSPTAPLQVGPAGFANQLLKVGVSGNMANSNAEILGSLAVLDTNTNSASVLGATAGNYYNAGNSPSWSGTLLEYWGTSYPGNVYGLAAANQGTLVFQNVSSGVIASNGANIYISPLGNVSTTFLTNGNVGIGTTNPAYPLSVNGTVRAKEVIVDTGWSDYVFADDYKLKPLSEVEQ